MKLTPMEKTPSSPVSPSSPLPLPLILLTPDSANPHLISKHRKVTATRALQRVDSYDSLHKDIFPPILHEGLKPFFPDEKSEKKDGNEENVEIETEMERKEQGESMINLKSVYEYSVSLFSSGYEMVSRKISGWCVFSGLNGTERAVWSSMAGVVLFFGAFMYVRKRDRRERQLLMLLLEEKDQRIAHMLQQIALINDIRSLSSRVAPLRKI